MLQFLQCREQIRHRPTPPIQSPHQHHIDFAAARRLQQLFSELPLRGAATDLLRLQGDRPTPPGGVLPEGANLQRDGLLVVGRDTGPHPDMDLTEANPKDI
jgi:hypothetical protein